MYSYVAFSCYDFNDYGQNYDYMIIYIYIITWLKVIIILKNDYTTSVFILKPYFNLKCYNQIQFSLKWISFKKSNVV
jgi:hypothetical protein